MHRWKAFCYALIAGICLSVFGAPPTYDHVVVVIEENHSLNQVIGSASAPYINSLAANGSSFTNMFAITHPSQPNYLHFFSGSAQGVTNDNLPSSLSFGSGTSNLGGALLNAGKSFIGYSESMPFAGYNDASFTTAQGDYMRKHNPWVNWQSASPTGFQLPIATNQPFTSFPADYSALPNVSIVIPNQTNDMHDGTVAQGDTWLQNNLAGYAAWAKTNNSLLIVTFDEDESASRNRIPTVLYGANVAIGQNTSTWTLHNLLRTIEDMYGTTHSGAAANVKSIVGSFASDPRTVTRSFQQNVNGYTSAQDTYLDLNTGSTSLTHGNETQVLVDGSPKQQGLIKFDDVVGSGPTQVTMGTKVFSAKLRIYTGNTSNDQSPNDFALYAMNGDWSDADSYDSLVARLGANYASSSAGFTLKPDKMNEYVVFDVTDTVQAWLDGTATNYGWLLEPVSGNDGWRFLSSNNGTADLRPYLEITVPEPTSLATTIVGLACAARRPRRERSA